MPRRRDPEPIEEQLREAAQRRADEARNDREYEAVLLEVPEPSSWERCAYPAWFPPTPEPAPDEVTA